MDAVNLLRFDDNGRDRRTWTAKGLPGAFRNRLGISLTKKISPARGSKYVGGNYAGLVDLFASRIGKE